MAVLSPTRLSPLHSEHKAAGASFQTVETWQVPNYPTTLSPLNLSDISFNGKLELKTTEQFQTSPPLPELGQALQKDDYLVTRLSLKKLFIVTKIGQEHRVQETVQKAKSSLVDQTAGYAGMQLSGDNACHLLSKLCAIDFHESQFPNLRVVQSSLAKCSAIVLRNDQENRPSFELYVARYYGVYIWQNILDAGKEWSISVV